MEEARFYAQTIVNKKIADKYAEILEQATWPEAMSITWFETHDESQEWDLRAYYEFEPKIDELNNLFVAQSLAPLNINIISLDKNINWVAESLTALAPIQAGRFFLHGKHDAKNCPISAIGLEIDANLAFGTGHHGTTKGCLIALDKILSVGAFHHAIDLGTGTGLLAIAAAKILKNQVIATDIDPVATHITRENASINNVSNLIKTITAKGFNHAELHKNAPYDLIIANILAKPLTTMAVDIRQHISMDGTLILSGLLGTQANWVSSYFKAQGFVEVDRNIIDQWATLIFTA
ncbi:MAG: 50S ribosomal protein L11 methyltransferase [Rhizobiales bacterium]|nr:50S ribosomal protein L11 methyltransferase [Hyphomicrobiales bacterium]NRB13964.1 50S ribosomal protein L11 methyltransferase [Hyphomicrobiales bacterium]